MALIYKISHVEYLGTRYKVCSCSDKLEDIAVTSSGIEIYCCKCGKELEPE